MFFVKFGGGARDPIWPIDIFLSQVGDAQAIMGYLLADASNGFQWCSLATALLDCS